MRRSIVRSKAKTKAKKPQNRGSVLVEPDQYKFERLRAKPRLLSDNGSSYISAGLTEWLEAQKMGHVRGAGKVNRANRLSAGVRGKP